MFFYYRKTVSVFDLESVVIAEFANFLPRFRKKRASRPLVLSQ